MATAKKSPGPATIARQMSLAELVQDEHNANTGTERGREALQASIKGYGFGRSILVDRNGRIIAGNKTALAAGTLDLEEVIVVPSDGTKIIAVMREDLDLETDPMARELAYADNRVAELDLAWDPQQLALDLAYKPDGVQLNMFWTPDELAALIEAGRLVQYEEGDVGEDAARKKAREYEKTAVRMVVLYYGAEEYAEIVDMLTWLREREGCETNTDALTVLLRREYGQAHPELGEVPETPEDDNGTVEIPE